MSCAQVAQLVEQRTENPRVGGSIPPLGTIFRIYLDNSSNIFFLPIVMKLYYSKLSSNFFYIFTSYKMEIVLMKEKRDMFIH